MEAATSQQSHTPPRSQDDVPAPSPSFRRYLADNPEASVAWAAAALVAAVVAVRTWAAAQGWFFYDDLGWQGLAAEFDRPGLELLGTSWNSHQQPLGWVVIWLFTSLAPLQFWPVVLSTAVLLAAYGWALFLVLRRLFGSRPEVLLLLAVGLLSTLTVSASLWWAVQLIQLPLLLAGALVVWAFLGYLQRRRLRDLVLTGGLLAVGLVGSERLLLVLPLLALLTAGWFSGSGGLPTAARRALREHRAAWLVLGSVGGAYAAWYVATTPGAAASGGSATLLLDVAWESVVHGLAPGLVGGPWTWVPVDEGTSLAEPGLLARVVAAAILGGAVLYSCAARRYAARGWGLLAFFVLVGVVMLTATRAPLVGAAIGREYRYFTELALVAPLALGLATLPVRWRSAGAPALQLRRRAVPRAVAEALEPWRPLGAAVSRRRWACVALACAALLVSSSISLVGYLENWSSNPAREWVATAVAELEAYPDVVVLDALVPDRVIPVVAGPYARNRVVLRPLIDPDRFLISGWAGDELRVLDDEGRLRPAAAVGFTSGDGPVEGCGWLVGPAPVTVPLQASTIGGTWLVRMSYFTQRDVTATMTAGDTSSQVLLRSGLHNLHLVAEGEVGAVTLSGLPEDAPVCVTGVSAGFPQPAAAP